MLEALASGLAPFAGIIAITCMICITVVILVATACGRHVEIDVLKGKLVITKADAPSAD